MKSLFVFLFITGVVFVFPSCGGLSARIERRRSIYDSECFEHMLKFRVDGMDHCVCLEEEFDLAEREVVEFSSTRRFGGISFFLFTESSSYYVLNLNNDGTLILYRFD